MALVSTTSFYLLPKELVCKISLGLSPRRAAWLSVVSHFFYNCRGAMESARRAELREEIRKRFAPLEGLFQHLRSYIWQIDQVIGRMILPNSHFRRRQIDHLLTMTGQTIIGDTNKIEKENAAVRFIALLSIDQILTIADNWPFLSDEILVPVCNVLVEGKDVGKALAVLQQVGNSPLKQERIKELLPDHIEKCLRKQQYDEVDTAFGYADKIFRTTWFDFILKVYLTREEFVWAIRFCGKWHRLSMTQVSDAFVQLRPLEEMDKLKKKIKDPETWDLFLYDVCNELIEREKLDEAKSVASKISNPGKQKQAQGRICEFFAKCGLLGQILEYMGPDWKQKSAEMHWYMSVMVHAGHFEPAIKILNELPLEEVLVKVMANHYVKPENSEKARTFAPMINDQNLRKAFLAGFR